MAVSISISIAQNSQNIANNTSNVTVKVTASWTGGSHNRVVNAAGVPQAKGWVKIDGTSYDFASTFNDGETTSGSKVICTQIVDVNHNSDGTKTLNCSASYTTGVSSGTVRASENEPLTTIPRKSVISDIWNGTLGRSQTLTITRHSTSFTHSLKAVCGSSTLYIKADGSTSTSEVKHNDCSIPFTPPLDWAKQNTTGTTVSVTFTITTYNGSTNVGSNEKKITCSIPSSVCPTCSIDVSDPTGIRDKYGAYVQGLSKLKVVVTPTLAYNSPIASYSTTANGVTYSSSSFTTGTLVNSVGNNITTKVVDKRGRSYSTSKSIGTTLSYSKPIISTLNVYRCDSNGNKNDQGDHVQVTFHASVTPLNNKNTAEYILKYKKSSDGGYTEFNFEEIVQTQGLFAETFTYRFAADTGSSYDVRVDVTDNHYTTSRTTSASTAFVMMHWNAAGDGMGIGKVSELPNVLDIGMQTRFYGGILQVELEAETDLNDVKTPGTYTGLNMPTYGYTNCPAMSGTFTLEVFASGDAEQVKQRVTYCHKSASRAWERFYYVGDDGIHSAGWGEWVCVSDYEGRLIWYGANYMTGSQTANLTEPVNRQRSGIVLVFSLYDQDAKAAKNQEFFEFFVPKYTIKQHEGQGRNFNLCGMYGNGVKYLYLWNDRIVGNDGNNADKTIGGITYNNSRYVLRYVIGV